MTEEEMLDWADQVVATARAKADAQLAEYIRTYFLAAPTDLDATIPLPYWLELDYGC